MAGKAAALTEHSRHSKRHRDLPAHAVAYYVMALSLCRGVNTEEVLRVVTEGMDDLGDTSIRREIGKSAISAARTRLGAEVMQTLARQTLTPLAQPQSACTFYRGLRIAAIDGTTLEVADEAKNRKAFGVPGAGQGQTGYPHIRCVGLLENGTHALFGVELGGYKESEVSLAHKVVKTLNPTCCAWQIAASRATRCGRPPAKQAHNCSGASPRTESCPSLNASGMVRT